MDAITSVTFFEGDVDVAALRGAVDAVLEANPWLAGRLVTHTAGGKPRICLWAPVQAAGVRAGEGGDGTASEHSIWTETVMDRSAPLQLDTPYVELMVACRPFLVSKGSACVDRDLPLFRVSLLHLQGKSVGVDASDASTHRFAVIVSLSHVIADGYTFYQIYGSLSCGYDGGSNSSAAKPAVVLNPTRIPDGTARTQAAGGVWGRGLHSLPCIAAMMWRMFVSGARPRITLYEIDPAWVEKQKQAHVAAAAELVGSSNNMPPWVSTNDVISSWWYRNAGGAGLYDAVSIILDGRGRVEGCSPDLAGNYEVCGDLNGISAASPTSVRRLLAGGAPYLAPDTPMPTGRRLIRLNYTISSSWVAPYRQLYLGGCRELLHAPVRQTVGFTANSGHFLDVLLVFRSTPSSIGVLCTEGGPGPSPRADSTPLLRQLFA